MSEPTSPDDAALGATERLHPLYLLTGLGGSLRGMAGGYAVLAYLVVSGRAGTAIVGALALLILSAIGLLLYWIRFQFRIGDNEIRIERGLLSRTHRSIPFARIQDVDITQGPLARLLGIAQVKFETGASGGQEEGVLPAIPLQRAEAIRARVRSLRAAEPSLAGASEEPPAPVYAMSNRRLLLAGTFNFSLAVFAGLVGITQTAGDALGFDPLSRRFWAGLLTAGSPIAAYLLEHRASAAIAGALLLILIGVATGVVRTTIRDYGFKLERTGVGLRRRRGLFTRTDVTLPVKRAQAVVLASGPIRQRFGWHRVSVQSLASDQGGQSDHVLAPLARMDEAQRIVGELGWRALPASPDWRRVSPAFVRATAVAVAPLFLVALIQMAVNVALGLGFAAVLAAAIGARWLAWRRTAYALDGDRLLIRSGWWRRRVTLLPTAKIQSADISENFVTRWFGVATLRLGVAGGGLAGHFIPAIPRRTARELREQLLDLSS
ncbi:MAG TPA: PH domain-containing protein [Sphingomicrobium sp.]|nr:PH domain-containing protein [Sphingomicrobium sp.]